jgi:hypothetical protein
MSEPSRSQQEIAKRARYLIKTRSKSFWYPSGGGEIKSANTGRVFVQDSDGVLS